MIITVKNCMEHELDSYKAEVCKYAKVKPEDIKIQAVFTDEGMHVIRYAYKGVLYAYMHDPVNKPHRVLYYVIDCCNFTGEYLEDHVGHREVCYGGLD